jgi:glutamine amidotransferase
MCRLAAFIGDLRAASGELRAFQRLALQNGDGFGIGGFVDGAPVLRKAAESALDNPRFTLEPWSEGRSAIAHLRVATVGSVEPANTHPFHVGGQIFAHNGTVGDVAQLEASIGARELRRLGVHGDTDSERVAAFLAQRTERAGGDVEAGYRLLAGDLAEQQPMTSITSLATTADGDVYALRYPENRSLFWKSAGTRDAAEGHRLLGEDPQGAYTVLASRPLDSTGAWNELMPGELLHVRAGDLRETVTKVVDLEPRLRLVDGHVDEGARWRGPRRSEMLAANLNA